MIYNRSGRILFISSFSQCECKTSISVYLHADFNIASILNGGPGEIVSIIGVDLYIAQIIYYAAKNAIKFNGFYPTTRQYFSSRLKVSSELAER
jgi:hypothetical protein